MGVARRFVLTILAVACISLAVFPGVAAQPIPPSTAVLAEQQSAQDRRLDSLEHMGIENRLTKVETQASEMSWELRSMLAGVGGLLVEAVFRIGKKAKRDG